MHKCGQVIAIFVSVLVSHQCFVWLTTTNEAILGAVFQLKVMKTLFLCLIDCKKLP